MSEDIAFPTISSAAALIQDRKLSSRELTEACLERARQLDPILNSFITVVEEAVLAEAAKCDQESARGNYRGMLHGIPIGVKDLIQTESILTTGGSKILAEFIPKRDATVIRQLKDAGAIVLGKTNLHEFAYGTTTAFSHYGPTYNPWRLDHVPGGSSGGSAAALAARICAGAIGTDTGGSIRIPASLCGVVGLKPTIGRVSCHGVLPLSWSLDHTGPMARTVYDVALLLNAMVGRDQNVSTLEIAPEDFTSGIDVGVKGLRLGIPRTYFLDDAEIDVNKAFLEGIMVFESLGARCREVGIADLQGKLDIFARILGVESLAVHDRYLESRPSDYTEQVRRALESGREIAAKDYALALHSRTEIIQELEGLFASIDILAVPTTRVSAPTLELAARGGRWVNLVQLALNTWLFNLTGQPAISVPCGFDNGGLPIGLMLVGRCQAERTVLRAAHAFEQATNWHHYTPPMRFPGVVSEHGSQPGEKK